MNLMIVNPIEVALSIIIVVFIGVISLKVKVVDRTGFMSAVLIGCTILIFGGAKWFLILLVFHVTAAICTKYKYGKKSQMEVAETKGGARSWVNIFSNGSIASISAVAYGFTSKKIFAAAFLATISTSIADTLATEIGLLNLNEPRLITSFKRVKAGTSGGVTLLGETAALFGDLLITFVALAVGFEDFSAVQVLTFSLFIGFISCNFDSVLGAKFQVTYKCQICGEITEKKLHCEHLTTYYKGNRFIDNNVVNFVSTVFDALIASLVYSFI